MRIEIVNIGSELLGGFTLNTNAAFLSSALTQAGYRIDRQSSLHDDPKDLEAGLTEAVKRGGIILTTGGLGPTLDDITRNTAAKLMGSDFHYDEEIANDLFERYGNWIKTENDRSVMRDQATVPSKAKAVKNRLGTAPGMIFEEEGAVLILMPGVPSEMKAMFKQDMLPFLKEHYPVQEEVVVERLHLFGLPESAVDPFLRHLHETYPKLEASIYPGLGIMEVHLKYHGSQKEAEQYLSAPLNAFREKFQPHLFSSASGTIEGAVHSHFMQHGLTLSTAESCTGGSASSRITRIAGASEYFLGGVVCYSNQMKQKVLGVPKEVIQTHGAVSEEVVSLMAKGIQNITESNYAIAVSGIAGPTGGTTEKPVGTVWCAIARPDGKTVAWKIKARGTRDMIIDWSVNALLSKLYVEAGGHG